MPIRALRGGEEATWRTVALVLKSGMLDVDQG
jgi:hypothetical protein